MSQLKGFKGQPTTFVPLPICSNKGLITTILIVVLDRKIAKVKNVVVVYWLIQWSNGSSDDATWTLQLRCKLNSLPSMLIFEDTNNFKGSGLL